MALNIDWIGMKKPSGPECYIMFRYESMNQTLTQLTRNCPHSDSYTLVIRLIRNKPSVSLHIVYDLKIEEEIEYRLIPESMNDIIQNIIDLLYKKKMIDPEIEFINSMVLNDHKRGTTLFINPDVDVKVTLTNG